MLEAAAARPLPSPLMRGNYEDCSNHCFSFSECVMGREEGVDRREAGFGGKGVGVQ